MESSWSDGRESTRVINTKVVIEKRIQDINNVLYKLSSDDDLRDDLKLPEVVIALNHWTGKHRLQPEEAERLLAENRRVMYVLQRLQMLQSICREAQVSVPFDSFLKSRSKLTDKETINLFGIENFRDVKKTDEEIVKSNTSNAIPELKNLDAKVTDQAVNKQLLPIGNSLIVASLVTIGIGVVMAALLFNISYIK